MHADKIFFLNPWLFVRICSFDKCYVFSSRLFSLMANHESSHSQNIDKITFAGMLIALGIVFGDIGTSPLYVFSAIVGTKTIDPRLARGGGSGVVWGLKIKSTLY